MSKTLRYDSLLVRALAAELEGRLAGARVHAIRFETAHRTVRIVTGRGTLVWDLRLQPGGLRLAPAAREEGTLPVRPGSRIAAIRVAPDERFLELSLERPADETGTSAVERIVIELFGAHANAFALDRGGVMLGSLRRGTAERPAERGGTWVPPEPSHRAGKDAALDFEAFRQLLAAVLPGERERALIRHAAWVSPINARAILGRAATETEDTALTEAWQRYRALVQGPARPVLLLEADGAQPYVRPLPGARAEPVPDLLTAFERRGGEPAPGPTKQAVLAAIKARRGALRRRLDRLRTQLEGATAEAATLRGHAGLLLSQAHSVPRGRSEALLDDFAGGTVRVALDPSLDAAANAERMYEQARRRARAAQRVPGLVRAAEHEAARLDRIEERVLAGGDAVEASLRAELMGDAAEISSGRVRPPVLPYRRYRSRGGLEIRVGRGARANDELTLRHARPEDIWLHARDAAGAHVVLVWGRRDQNPPESDLVDAALLAALHSRARTSKTVPVDWTRRKYVRKPRKSPPGLVVLERGRTLFVEPDPEAAERLRLPGYEL